MKISIDNYQDIIGKIGLSKLSDGEKEAHELIKEGSDNFSNLAQLKELMDDPDIGETIQLYFDKLQGKLPSEKKEEPAPPAPKKETKPKSNAKPKSAAPRKSAKPKVKAASKKASRKAAKPRTKVITKTVKEKPAAHTTVRKIKSPDLQVLTRISNMGKKQQSHETLQRFVTQLDNALSAGKYADHGGLIKEIHGKLAKMLEKNSDAYKVQLSEETAAKVAKAISGAKERLRVSFLAGVDSDTFTGKRWDKKPYKLVLKKGDIGYEVWYTDQDQTKMINKGTYDAMRKYFDDYTGEAGKQFVKKSKGKKH